MNKTKLLIILLLLPALIIGCSCKKQDQDTDNGSGSTGFEILEREAVQETVKDWVVYTNPAFQYELRSPKNWTIDDIEKKGEEVKFYPKKKEVTEGYNGEMRILGYANWQHDLGIEKFVKSKAPENYYNLTEEIEDFNYKNFAAVWFKSVTKDEQTYDVIVFKPKDRLIVIEMYGSYDDLTDILGSMYFYQ